MNSTSYQTSHYNHAHQASIQGSSNLKIFAGEDLTSGDRKRMQQMQSDYWWKQQMEEKQRKNHLLREEKEIFDNQTREITHHRTQLEEEKAKRLRDMEIAFRQTNLQQMDEKLQRDQLDRSLDTQERLNHIEYLNNHDFFTENTATCQSQLGKNRVLPYHWKGMSQEQKQRILDEQEKQIQEKKLQKEIEKEEDRLFA